MDKERRRTKIQIAGKFLTVFVLQVHDEIHFDRAGQDLSGRYLALFSQCLSLHTHLFAVCD